MAGSIRPPLSKENRFSSKKSSSPWWLWIVGTVAIIAMIFLIAQTGPSSNQDVHSESGNELSASKAPEDTDSKNFGVVKKPKTLAEELGFPSSPEHFFSQSDTNGDFKLNSEEFCKANSELQQKALQEAFKVLDSNKDEHLVITELYKAYRPFTVIF